MNSLEHYHQRREAKVCTRCKVPTGGPYACAECLIVLRETLKRTRERKRERKECLRCSSPARTGKHLCRGCAVRESERNRERYKEWAAERHAAGLCISCPNKHEGKLRCPGCSLKIKVRAAALGEGRAA